MKGASCANSRGKVLCAVLSTYLHTSLASLFGALVDEQSPSEVTDREMVLQRMMKVVVVVEEEEAREWNSMILIIWR